MDFVFADDANQSKPSRLGTGKLVAIGGVWVPAAATGPLEHEIERLCNRVGFPQGEQFKWSPGARERFMHDVLVGEPRYAFYKELFGLAADAGALAYVVVADSQYKTARRTSETHEDDITALFLERTAKAFRSTSGFGVVVVATPSGGYKEEQKFLGKCVGLLTEGTEYERFGSLPLGVFAAPSRRIRLLQLADVVASCTASRIAGEGRYSPDVFELIRPLLARNEGHAGGVGLKIHPEFIYLNLYYWLAGDTHTSREGVTRPLPDPAFPFADHPDEAIITQEIIRAGREQT